MKPFGYEGATSLLTLASQAKGYALGKDIGPRDESHTIPAPVVASVSQYWEGNDGPWSSFAIQVGKTAQDVRVFPSTVSSSTLVVVDAGCPEDAPSNCKDARGGLFNKNNSLTWVPNSIFDVGIEENLGFNVFGDFGFDTVTLGWPGSGEPTVEHSIVAGLGDTTLTWLGVLGLNPRPTNFSTMVNNPQISFVQSLRNQRAIPSVSWSYTAGAQYRLDKIYGSLIFGGFDTSRFTPSKLTFPFYQDISRDFLVGVQKISTSSSDTPLLSTGIFALIDSTIPYLYLPQSACEAFEKAFGITWNSTAELYLLNSTQHDSLLKMNANITFTLGTTTSGGDTVDIVLPYSAFDLNISWPYVFSNTRYFPLKRAANDTQYTLGRTFLQEAYLIADYERSNFSVNPCKWEANAKSSIVAIRSLNDSSEPPSNSTNSPEHPGASHSSLSGGTITGVAIGSIFGVAVIALGIWYFLRRRGICGQPPELDANDTALEPNRAGIALGSIRAHKDGEGQELDSSGVHELPSHHKFGVLEAPGGDQTFPKRSELEGRTARRGHFTEVFEMDSGPLIRVEPPTAIEPKAPDLPIPEQTGREQDPSLVARKEPSTAIETHTPDFSTPGQLDVAEREQDLPLGARVEPSTGVKTKVPYLPSPGELEAAGREERRLEHEDELSRHKS